MVCPLVSLNRLVIALAVALVMPLSSHQSPATSVILGRVVEGLSEVPVSDALITCRGRAEPYLTVSALTDADGNFVLFNLPAGSYDLTASKTGYWFGEFGQRRAGGYGRSLVLADGQRADGITVPMWKFAAISGLVTDESGDPVVGLMVQAMTRSVTGGRLLVWNTSPQTARTDDRGMYRLFDLVPGEFVVSIPASEVATIAPRSQPSTDPAGELAYPPLFYPGGSADAVSAVAVGSGEERGGIDFRLQMVRTRRLAGRVVGSADPSGIAVRLTRPDESFLDDFVIAEAATRADGSFVFDRVLPGNYVLRVFEVSAGTAGAVSAGGSFRAVGGPPVSVRPPRQDTNGWWAAVPIIVADASLEDVSVELHACWRISGQVVFNGAAPKLRVSELALLLSAPTPPSGRRVTGNVRAQAEVDETFRFRTMELPAGQYFLRWAPGWPSNTWTIESIMLDGRDALDQPLTIADHDVSGMVITLTDKISEVTGTVRGAIGTPDLDTAVLVFPADPAKRTDFGRESPRMRYTRVNLDGLYSVKGLPAGEYEAVAIKDEFTDGWQASAMLERLSRGATRFTVAIGGKQALDLRTSQIR